MTVGQLILFLQKYEPGMKVVVKDTQMNALNGDFVDLELNSISKIKTKPLFKEPVTFGRQLYDSDIFKIKDNGMEVISLTGKPWSQK